MEMRIAGAPKHRLGYFQARPGDVAGRSDLVLVDVRTERDLEVDRLGHIHGVLLVPMTQVLEAGLPGLAQTTPVAVVCNNGRASEQAAAALVQRHGFFEVYHLVGGMTRWVAEDRPVARRATWRTLEG